MSSSNTSSLRNPSEDKPERNDFLCYNCNEVPQIKIKEDENQIEITCHCFPFPTKTQTKTIKVEDILKELKKPYEKKNFCSLCSSSSEAKYYDTENEKFICQKCFITRGYGADSKSIFPSEHLIIKNKCQNNSCKRKEEKLSYCLNCNGSFCSSCIEQHDLEAHETVSIKEMMDETEFKAFKEKLAVVYQKMLSDNKKYEGIISELEKNLNEAKSFYEKWRKENESILCLLNSMMGTYENYFQNKFDNYNSVHNLLENDPREIFNQRRQVFKREFTKKLNKEDDLFSAQFSMKEKFNIQKRITITDRYKEDNYAIRITYVEATKNKDIIAGDASGRIYILKYVPNSDYLMEDPIKILDPTVETSYELYKKDQKYIFAYNYDNIVYYDLFNRNTIWTYEIKEDSDNDQGEDQEGKELINFSVLSNGNLAYIHRTKGMVILGEDLETLQTFKGAVDDTFLKFVEIKDGKIVVLGESNIFLYEKNESINQYDRIDRISNPYNNNSQSEFDKIDFKMAYLEKEGLLFVSGQEFVNIIDLENFQEKKTIYIPSLTSFIIENNNQVLIKVDDESIDTLDERCAHANSLVPTKHTLLSEEDFCILDLKTFEWQFIETEGEPKWRNYAAYDEGSSLLCEGNEIAIWEHY